MNSKIKVGIIGGAGYTAGELIRILIYHPDAEIAFLQSDSQADKAVAEIHQDLEGDLDLAFTKTPAECDVAFICRGHGQSKSYLESKPLPGNPKIIDLSSDYRLKGQDHDFVYGLPEAYRNNIQKADRVANPGCFATCLQLGVLPLAGKNLLNETVNITAVTGSTGAGVGLTSTSHFSWRHNNLSVYKPFHHQHLGEIKQTLNDLSPSVVSEINFIPIRGNFTRGIFSTTYLKSNLSAEEAQDLYIEYYRDHPFSVVSSKNPDLKQVLGTNKALIYLEKIDDKLLIIAAIDNLIKGASGQAVQNMNLMFGLEETAGLKLKSIAF